MRLSINYLDVSNNGFTGTFPPLLFAEYSPLVQLVASINCFDNNNDNILPQNALCTNSLNLSSLILDGLQASPLCRDTATKALLKGAIIRSCIYYLTGLTSLHLSGNGFSGTLQPEVGSSNRNCSIIDLQLSHNRFHGTIPTEISSSDYRYLFSTIDLSFNRFQGTVPSHISFNTSTSLSLEDNRLSGSVPFDLVNSVTKSINLLEGNLFTCNLQRNNLPKYDPNYATYICGSDSTNATLVVWLILIILLALGILIIFKFILKKGAILDISHILRWLRSLVLLPCKKLHVNSNDRTLDSLLKFYNDLYAKQQNQPIFLYFIYQRQYFSLALFISLISLLLFMPLYGLLTVLYGTYSDQYVWTISFMFFSGIRPTIILFALCCILIAICLLALRNYATTSAPTTEATSLADLLDGKGSSWFWKSFSCCTLTTASLRQLTVYFTILIFNCVVVLVVNGSYVLAVESNLSIGTFGVIIILFSLFKILWGDFVLLKFVGEYIIQSKLQLHEFNRYFFIVLFLFNNIVAPNCFLYLTLENPPTVTTSFTEPSCQASQNVEEHELISIECFPPLASPDSSLYYSHLSTNASYVTTVDFNYIPPFIYGYQCSSSLLQAFMYVFIVRYIFTGIINPIFLYLLYITRSSSNNIKEERQNSFMQHFYSFIDLCKSFLIPRLLQLKRVASVVDNSNVNHPVDVKLLQFDLEILSTIVHDPLNYWFDRKAINEVLDFALLLTFGVLFPPLGVAIVWTIFMNIIITTLILERFMMIVVNNQVHINTSEIQKDTASLAECSKDHALEEAAYDVEQNPMHHEDISEIAKPNNNDNNNVVTTDIILYLQRKDYNRLLELVFVSVNGCLQKYGNKIWEDLNLTIYFSACVWSFSLFDTLGDSVGGLAAIWIIFVMSLSPLWLRIFVNDRVCNKIWQPTISQYLLWKRAIIIPSPSLQQSKGREASEDAL